MTALADHLALLDYRRRVAECYAEVRARPADADTWHWWRERRDELFATHVASPYDVAARTRLAPLPYFEHDPALRVEVSVEPAPPQRFEIAHSAAGITPAERIGQVRLPLGGDEHTLSLYWLDIYGGGIFLPFRDATCGTETYGGGRYLLDTAKGADLGGGEGRLVVDLNYAYHPSCAHDPAWSCPLAPPENQLSVPVRAGERLG